MDDQKQTKIKIKGSQNGKIKTVNEAVDRINREIEEKTTYEKAKELKMGYIDVASTPINPDLLYIIDPAVAHNALILPFFRIGKKLRVAVSDLQKKETQDALEKLKELGYLLNINLASQNGLNEALKIYDEIYHEKKPITNMVETEKLEAYEKEIQNLTYLKEKFQEITSEEALNYINVGAFKTGASDVHYQPEETLVVVRFRIDGVLQTIFRLEKHVFENIANQLKYKAKMKLNITNVPQDGRFSFIVNQRKIDVRVAALPTEYGETFVCRLLDSKRSNFDFETLGFQGTSLKQIKNVTDLVNGMILVTGPTGSGKTTTLYSILDKFNSPERKIITLEDPIEYHLEMISQSQINEKRGYDFANGLKSILRQDPDIIMIGEIRDLETAQTAAQAALTGHVVLSTLHTNSAVETIPRLLNMGLPAFMIAPSLNIIMAQRLLRRVCKVCAEERILENVEKQEIQEILEKMKVVVNGLDLKIPEKVKKALACEACSHTGYSGQIAILEVLEVDEDIKRLILNNASTEEIFKKAREKGMLTMKEDGIIKMIHGITTLEELNRVTK